MNKFILPIIPIPKARHRTTIRGGHAIAYTDPKARGDIETFIAHVRQFAPKVPTTEAVSLVITAYLPIPVSWSQKKRTAAMTGRFHHTKKPDCDNYLKFACDCMNGLFWIDDSQVITATIQKRYSNAPRWEINITELL